MLTAGLPIYEHGDGRLIHPIKVKVRGANNSWTVTAALGDIGVPLMRGFMSQAAMFERPGRKGWTACEPPERVAKLILGRRGFWRFPKIRGLVCVPTLRPDGTLLSRPGFDAETGLYLFDPPEMPPLPDHPTKDDAATGLALFNELLDEFPFRDNQSHSVAMSGLLTPVVRGMFDVVPMHAFSSPQAGTGKSYLADLASVLISGQRCAVSTVSRLEEENEKRLGGTLLQGYPVLSIDNVDIPLNSAFLCQVIERSWLEIRILGTSNKPRVAPSLVLFCTGNNLVLVGDLVRRTVTALLDAECERPWTRRFKRNPLDMLLAARGHYIAAALNIVRAYLAAGKPAQKLEPFASFETWSNTVRAALVWLDQADPVETVAAQFEQDPDLLRPHRCFSPGAKTSA
jgi:putative DNA primase/helicase